jgi:hypothetical protein
VLRGAWTYRSPNGAPAGASRAGASARVPRNVVSGRSRSAAAPKAATPPPPRRGAHRRGLRAGVPGEQSQPFEEELGPFGEHPPTTACAAWTATASSRRSPAGAPSRQPTACPPHPWTYGGAARRSYGPWGFGTSFGTLRTSVARSRSFRDAALRQEAPDLQVFPAMARPGLEPGTPRFSGSRGGPVPPAKHLQIARFEAAMPRRDTGGCGRLRAGLGLQGGLEVPNDPRSTTSWVRSTSSSWRDGRERCRVARSSYWPPWGRSSRG